MSNFDPARSSSPVILLSTSVPPCFVFVIVEATMIQASSWGYPNSKFVVVTTCCHVHHGRDVPVYPGIPKHNNKVLNDDDITYRGTNMGVKKRETIHHSKDLGFMWTLFRFFCSHRFDSAHLEQFCITQAELCNSACSKA
jgi:hypothetical protein